MRLQPARLHISHFLLLPPHIPLPPFCPQVFSFSSWALSAASAPHLLSSLLRPSAPHLFQLSSLSDPLGSPPAPHFIASASIPVDLLGLRALERSPLTCFSPCLSCETTRTSPLPVHGACEPQPPSLKPCPRDRALRLLDGGEGSGWSGQEDRRCMSSQLSSPLVFVPWAPLTGASQFPLPALQLLGPSSSPAFKAFSSSHPLLPSGFQLQLQHIFKFLHQKPGEGRLRGGKCALSLSPASPQGLGAEEPSIRAAWGAEGLGD